MGEIFYQHLAQLAGETIHIDGDYPVNLTDSVLQLLRYAQQNEYEEHDHVYQDFARIAMEEGFPGVADSFARIAEIEKVHGDRFGFFCRPVRKQQTVRFGISVSVDVPQLRLCV